MRQLLLFCVFCLATAYAAAQAHVLSGRVTNSKLEPLAFATVQVQELQRGTTTKEDGAYELQLEAGTYHLVFSMVGYRPHLVTITLTQDATQNMILEEAEGRLSEVIVSGKRKDAAEEIIRNVIRAKEKTVQAAGPFSCRLYIKATQQDSGKLQASRKGTKATDTAVAQLAQMAMAEISLKLDYESIKHIKEERIGVKKEGASDRLFYLSVTDGFFDFYNNVVNVPALSATPFVSPVSYGGLLAYRFKTVKITPQGAFKLHTISVRPRALSNATVSGELVISDSDWTIRSTHFSFPKYHLPEYDHFELAQTYALVDGRAWMLATQQFGYSSKSKAGKLSGQTVVTYSGYELQKHFARNYFGTEVSATTSAAYSRDSSFWQTARTVPLTAQEIRFIHYRDSLYNATHTIAYLDSVDKAVNKITWKKIGFAGQTFYNREKERSWTLPPLVSLFQPFAFGGSRLNALVNFQKTYPSKRNLSVFSNLSYGFRNQDVNGSVRLSHRYNPFNRGFYTLAAGRDFQAIFQGDAWINMLKRSNIYLNNFVSVGHGLELLNGLFFYSDAEVALRRSVSHFKTGTLIDSLAGDALGNNQPVPFEPYNATYLKLRLQYTPRQRYLREPKEKIILGSAWPTFYTQWRAGVPRVFSSKVQFQYLEFGLEQQVNFRLLGQLHYTLKTGRFTDTKDLRLIDYQFQRRGDPVLFLNPDEAFQALDSSFPLFKRFYQGHLVHEFNGALLNKLPLFKKIGLREIAGAGFLLAPERHLRYAEIFTGVERVFKWPFNPLTRFKIGAYVVGSAANQFRNPVHFKIGITSWDPLRNRWF